MNEPIILAIDTSCDETAAAVVQGRRILGNAIYSQILSHKQWGGVVPSLAKRAHEERIDFIVAEALKRAGLALEQIEIFAATQGPGLAIALEVGIKKAKELAALYKKPLVAVNHMEGHIYSVFAQNRNGNPEREFVFPYLALLVSGGHTEFIKVTGHGQFELIGHKVDDAAGEALDKAGRMLGLGYPAGAAIERLAKDVDNVDIHHFPRPMIRSHDLNFSFSGLKTAMFYCLKKMSDQEKVTQLKELASSFQEAVVDTLVKKAERAMEQTGITSVILAGGVAANQRLRLQLQRLVKKHNGSVLYPTESYLNGDNAAMIGIVAGYKAQAGVFSDPESFDRDPRLPVTSWGMV